MKCYQDISTLASIMELVKDLIDDVKEDIRKQDSFSSYAPTLIARLEAFEDVFEKLQRIFNQLDADYSAYIAKEELEQ